MIRLDRICLRAGDFRLKDVSFSVPAGKFAVLMGQTGCGKTTLLESICGLRDLQSGEVHLAGRNVTRWPTARRGVGYVPQDGALFTRMSVRENVGFALKLQGEGRESIATRTEQLAESLSIRHLLPRRAAGLSGGEVQRVALGRALAADPAVLLLDEPLSALDEETREQMVDLLRRTQRQTGVTVLHVTHSQSEANALADVRLVMSEGGVTELPCLPGRHPTDDGAAFSLSNA